MPPTSSPCLLPSPSTPSPVPLLPSSVFRLRFLSSFALISSARSHLFALPSFCSSSLALSFLPTDRPAIASRSPGHILAKVGRGPPRPALVVIPSPPPRHHRAADRQQGRAIPSRSPCRPSPPRRGLRAHIPADPGRGRAIRKA